MFLDFHWHARDLEQAAKETVAHSLQVAEAAGINALGFMPNPKRALTTLERWQEYFALADAVDSPVKSFGHIGLTANPEQQKGAVEAFRVDPRIIGMKQFCCKSTGDLSILLPEQQYSTLENVTKEGFDGIIMFHFGQQSLMKDYLFTRENPRTWSELCRPSYVEEISFDQVLEMAEDVKFKGGVHATHVSSLHVVNRVATYEGPLKVSCDITPHHLLRDNSYLNPEKGGVENKCNPPLRPAYIQQGLLQMFKDDKINFLASDHAPHLPGDKHPTDSEQQPASGIATGPSWPYIVAHLRRLGISDKQLHRQTFQNAKDLFTHECNPTIAELKPTLQPDYEKLARLQKDYHHNIFGDL